VLLRGLGGATVAAPFLSSVAEREAKAQGMTATAPRRLIVFFTHFGCVTDRWFPARSHGPLSSADYAALSTLAPMAPYASKLLMVRGIRTMNEWSFQGTLGQKNDPHAQVCSSYFTGHPVTPNATDAFNSGSKLFSSRPTGRSLDHICAEQVNPVPAGADKPGAPLAIPIGGTATGTNEQTAISFNQPQQYFPGISSPAAIYNNLTNLFGTGPVSPDTYRAARGKSILDLVRADLKRLQSFMMSKADQQKLSDWADLLHDASAVVTPMCTQDFASTGLGLTVDSVKAPGSGGSSGTDYPTLVGVMQDLAVLSAICDSNRVIFINMPGAVVYKHLGLTLDSHSISHRIGNAGMGGACVANAIDMIQTIDKWYAELFARLVGRLDSFTEGNGRTVLDNSATVWFQEMSDGNSHNLNNLPILQAGSCGGYFRTGQAINVEGGVANLTQGNSSADCANGQSPFNTLDTWGTPPDVATMPINKYHCNLMNALGVKAGPDGWAAVGGTAPVTKFGKYDDTTLFADGGTHDPVIANPGEYAELRAT
jgi:hypothetical protein